jgi:hypothetical protein
MDLKKEPFICYHACKVQCAFGQEYVKHILMIRDNTPAFHFLMYARKNGPKTQGKLR